MIIDADEFSKALGKTIKKAFFEANMMIQQKPDVRYIPDEELLKIANLDESDGGLNKAEREQYGPAMDWQCMQNLQAELKKEKKPEIPEGWTKQ
ncbi:MAG: hypothetical protein L6428_09720 [Candidatus Aminicenantes bacterium]|nr:hypothetical protein [Candidatus Aminicenantes bacterium]